LRAALVLIALRMPVGVAMLAVGGLGSLPSAPDPLLAQLKSITYSKFRITLCPSSPCSSSWAEFAGQGGLSAALYRAGRAWSATSAARLAIATIGACAAFGAICGSSLATAATMSQVAGPQMRNVGYSLRWRPGRLRQGARLGILIPPVRNPGHLAVYTEQSIGRSLRRRNPSRLIATLQYMIVVAGYCRLHPDAAPRARSCRSENACAQPATSGRRRSSSCLSSAASTSAGFPPPRRRQSGRSPSGSSRGPRRDALAGRLRSLLSTAQTTAMIAIVLLGAELFSAALALSQMPTELSRKVAALHASPLLVIAVTS